MFNNIIILFNLFILLILLPKVTKFNFLEINYLSKL